jgi:murein DD-endopeptidase MepM/ murein hydrolase activator NlpD
VNYVDLWGLSPSDKGPTIILSDDEKNKLDHGVPITPIEVGKYEVTSGYGPRNDIVNGQQTAPVHNGIDFAAPQGTPVRSVFDGVVKDVNYNDPIFGNNVTIQHNNRLETFYAHLEDDSITVKEGDHVVGGQVFGGVGSTGFSDGPHLHYEERIDGTPRNPGY